ncbi:hypothetical protein SRED_002328 [Spiroplasma melliferum]|uniref:Uncharacterized protein n=2 Tax=Spiroplasma melliferum TaxID=2134 RepID=A0AAI9T484_SPIME|nr:hypothetical protein SPM_003085 [Spiroplasma melliferum KC3]QCO23854.1 hypothetical protein SRED_002328 [Spiroplasma melliferum]
MKGNIHTLKEIGQRRSSFFVFLLIWEFNCKAKNCFNLFIKSLLNVNFLIVFKINLLKYKQLIKGAHLVIYEKNIFLKFY